MGLRAASFRSVPSMGAAATTMADLVAPGVWWLHRTRGSNVYLVQAADGQLALIDTGFGSNVRAILDEVRSVAGETPLAFILLTHNHFDHTGAALELRNRTGARVAAGLGDCTPAPNGNGRTVTRTTGRSHIARFVSRWLLRRRNLPLPVDLVLDGETEVLPGLRAYPAPGHTPGSFCFVATGPGVAFVGDMVISHHRRLSRPMALANADNNLYEQSLAAFAQVSPPIGCPGHGQPLTAGFDAALRGLTGRTRRPPSIAGLRRRAVRLRTFMRNMYRRRSPRREP